MINQEQSDWNVLGTRLSDVFKEPADKVGFVKVDDEVLFAEMARPSHLGAQDRGNNVDHLEERSVLRH
jgi:hypothetical protein